METFVVRVWVPAAAEPWPEQPASPHGIVEHVGSQRSRTFHDDAELLAFVHECLRAGTIRPARPGPAR